MSAVKAVCGATTVLATIAAPTIAANVVTAVATFTGLPTSTLCQVTSTGMQASNATGGTTLVPVNMTFTTSAVPAYWPPTTINAVGIFGTTYNQFLTSCVLTSDACWGAAVASGIPKFYKTNAKMTGTAFAGREIVFAIFKTSAGNSKVVPMFLDDGSLAGGNLSGGVSVDWNKFGGTANGFIVRETATNLCYEYTWYPPTVIPGVNSNIWSPDLPVVCP